MKIKTKTRAKSRLFFRKPFNELQTLIKKIGEDGEWKKCSETHHQFSNIYGAHFNWWQNTGTVTVTGNKEAAKTFRYKFLKEVSDKYREKLS